MQEETDLISMYTSAAHERVGIVDVALLLSLEAL